MTTEVQQDKVIEEIILNTNFKIQEPYYSSYKKVTQYIKKAKVSYVWKKELSEWKFRNHTIEDFMVWFPFNGGGKITINNTDYTVKPGKLSVFSPGDEIIASEELLYNLHVYSIRFSIPDDQLLFKYLIMPVNVRCASDRLKTMFDDLFKAETQKKVNLLKRRIFLNSLFDYMIEKNLLSLSKDFYLRDNKFQKLIEVLRYIKNNLGKRIYLSELQKVSSLNKPTIIKLFAMHLKKTPIQYINEEKVSLAKKYFAQDLSIREVSVKVGFSDAFTFSKVFKKIAGTSPGRFKTRLKDGNFLDHDMAIQQMDMETLSSGR